MNNIESKISTKELEFLAREKVGLLLIKPDAIDLGIEDYVIEEFCLQLEGEAEIDQVCAIRIDKPEQVRSMYPNLTAETYRALEENLLYKESILISFSAIKRCDLWKILMQVKGPSMWHWDQDIKDRTNGAGRFVRRWLPLPGSNALWKSVQEKVATQSRMTDEEFKVYSQNLVHTPSEFDEFCGLINLFPEKIKKQVLKKIYATN